MRTSEQFSTYMCFRRVPRCPGRFDAGNPFGREVDANTAKRLFWTSNGRPLMRVKYEARTKARCGERCYCVERGIAGETERQRSLRLLALITLARLRLSGRKAGLRR